jgi:hypothetical protein
MTPTLILVFGFTTLTFYALFRIVSLFLESEDEQIRHELLDDELRRIEQLVARKSALLQSLKDIEFDRETGKLAEQDYDRLRSRYERKALDVMRELDALRGGVDHDDAIDAALQERLEGRPEADDVDVPAEVPDREEGAEESNDPASVDCPECGRELEAEARFCSRCGTPLGARSDAGPAASDELDEGPTTPNNDDGVADELRSEATG